MSSALPNVRPMKFFVSDVITNGWKKLGRGGGENQLGHVVIGGLESRIEVRLFADDTVVYVAVHCSS